MVRGGAGADGVETGGEDGAVLLVPPSRTVRGSVTDLGLSQAARPRLRTVLATEERSPCRTLTVSLVLAILTVEVAVTQPAAHQELHTVTVVLVTVVLAVNIQVAVLAGEVTLQTVPAPLKQYSALQASGEEFFFSIL